MLLDFYFRDRSDEYEPKVKRDLLRIREYKVDLDSRLGM